jgi:hypothetical protein
MPMAKVCFFNGIFFFNLPSFTPLVPVVSYSSRQVAGDL